MERKFTTYIASAALLLLFFMTGCIEDYLDKAPESGLSKEEVFSKRENFRNYFEAVYSGGRKDVYGTTGDWNIKCAYPLKMNLMNDYPWSCLTDEADGGRLKDTQTIRQGRMGSYQGHRHFTYNCGFYALLGPMFSVIRTANTALENIGMLKDASQEEKWDLIGQAHFVRAFAHFELYRNWGGMPYIDYVIGSDDEWDIPRLSNFETAQKIAADFDSAAIYLEKAHKMRRDPGPGSAGHLNNPEQEIPNGVAALAFKSRALLYGASPLSNANNDMEAWKKAAAASWEAIQVAEQYGYALQDSAGYKLNFVGTTYTNEQIWAWYALEFNYRYYGTFLNPGVFANGKTGWSGECPSQNTVDRFETKWGDPLRTPAERDEAATLGHYNEQDPYNARDPRFYIDIMYNQAPILGFGKAHIYYEVVDGAVQYGQLIDPSYAGITRTGYYTRKTWGDQSVNNQVLVKITDPLMRLAELYLNYAEAANEAYGPNSPAPGASMSAVQAVNLIRNRVGMTNVQSKFTGNKEIFRERIKNERFVEFCLEGGHYFHDIRRWKDAPRIYEGPMMGMEIEKVPVSETYPTGFKYTRKPLEAARQIQWREYMWYFPFDDADNFKMKKFTPNPRWN